MSVNPTADTFARFQDEDDGGPVVMLNLLRFAGQEGREQYARYAAGVGPFLERVGASVLYAGACSTLLVGAEAHRWDAVLVVRYPSRTAFAQMVSDPDYLKVSELRTSALEAAVLEATTPWG